MTTTDETSPRRARRRRARIEANGINVIDESERKGTPAGLFWPWCASNISVLAVSVRRVRARLRHRALAGARRGRGRRRRVVLPGRPGLDRRQARLGADAGAVARAVRPLGQQPARPGLLRAAGRAGRPCWSRCRPWPRRPSSSGSAGATATAPRSSRSSWSRLLIVLRRDPRLRPDHAAAEVPDDRADHRHRRLRRPDRGPHPPRHAARPARTATTSAVIGAAILVLTGFGLGWVNTAADYSRYLPRNASTAGVVWWPTFGGSLPVVLLVGVRRPAGRLVAEAERRHRQRPDRRADHDPADVVPAAVRDRRGARPGQRRGDGHLLLRPDPAHARAAGPRAGSAAGIDGVLMILGADLHRLVSPPSNFIYLFEALPDHPRRPDGRLVRRLPGRPAAAPPRLRRGRRCSPRAASTARSGWQRRAVSMAVGTVVGWGLVIDTTARARAWAGSATSWTRSALGGEDRRLGLRQPRRPGRPGHRLRRLPALRLRRRTSPGARTAGSGGAGVSRDRPGVDRASPVRHLGGRLSAVARGTAAGAAQLRPEVGALGARSWCRRRGRCGRRSRRAARAAAPGSTRRSGRRR